MSKKTPSSKQSKKVSFKVDEHNTPESVLVEYIKVGQTDDIEQLFKDFLIDPNLPIYDKNAPPPSENDEQPPTKVVSDYPFLMATRLGFVDVVNILVKNRANINIRLNGDNAFHIAVSNSDEAMLKALFEVEAPHQVKKGAMKRIDIDCENDKNLRPIDIAIQNNNSNLVRILLEAGADFDFDELGADDHTLLHQSAVDGDIKRFNFLLELKQSPYKKDVKNGKNILHYAVLHNRKEFIEHYSKLKLDENLIYGEDMMRMTPVHEACLADNWEIVKLLTTKFNFDINMIFTDSMALLHRFTYLKKLDICEKIIGLKAKVNGTDKYGNTPLHWACSSGSLEMVKYYVDKKLPITDVNNLGNTPLHISSHLGFLEIVEFLLSDKKVNVSVINKENRTPLMEAVSKGHTKVAELLISKGTNISTEDSKGMTPLQLALNDKQEGCCILLVNKGALVNRKFIPFMREASLSDIKQYMFHNTEEYISQSSDEQTMEKLKQADPGYKTIFQQAIAYNMTSLVREMVKKHECPLEEIDVNGYTPLLNAIRIQNREIVKILTSSGANVQYHEPVCGITPLILATKLGNLDICSHLINDCKVSTIDIDECSKKSALHYACKVGNTEIARLLILHGSKVDSVDSHLRTPLFEACENGYPSLCELLLNSDADIEHRDNEGFTCVHMCCFSGKVESLQVLIDYGANLNTKDNAGRTPLIVSSQSGNTLCGRSLVQATARKNKAQTIE